MKNRFLDIENVRNEKITEIHKTQLTVSWSTSETGSWLGFSRSPEHVSFVKLREIDSLTSKTLGVKKLRKSMRPNRQYLWVPAKPEVDLEFQSHPEITVVWNYDKQIPWHRNSKEWRNYWNPKDSIDSTLEYLRNRKLTWIFEVAIHASLPGRIWDIVNGRFTNDCLYYTYMVWSATEAWASKDMVQNVKPCNTTFNDDNLYSITITWLTLKQRQRQCHTITIVHSKQRMTNAASVPTSSLRVQILAPNIPGSVRRRHSYAGLADLIIQKTQISAS